jgi:type VI secretion system protein ImpL
MGLINQDVSQDISAFHTRAMGVLADRLRDLRLLLFHKADSSRGVDPGLLLFPEEFERLKSGLNAFVKGAFQENPYQETPLLRGLFFTSGRQEGSPYSHFLKALGLIQERDVLPGTNKGLFLHDVFGRILPRDRELFAPTQRAIEWSRLTRNLGLTSWVAVAIAICGLLSFSFVKNLRTLRVVSREFSKPPVLQGDIVSDVVIMDHFRKAISKVEDQNSNWWIPRFGLNESREVEGRLKEQYCQQFKGSFLVPFDKEMGKTMTHFSSATSDSVIGDHVAHLARRINLLRAKLEREPIGMLYAMPQPSYAPIVSMADQALIPEIREKFADQYLSYLEWRSDESDLNQEMNGLQTWLKHVLTIKGSTLHWIVPWFNSEGTVAALGLEDFWGGSRDAPQEVSVVAAFTVKGKEKIDAFVKEIEAALVDPLVIASQKLEFYGWYRKAYLDAWYRFAEGFPAGAERLQGREERQQIAARMATGEGPYYSLLDRMTIELEPAVTEEQMPAWVGLVYAFEATKIKAAQEAAVKGKGALAKVTKRGKSLMTKLEKTMGKLDAQDRLESELLAARALGEYVDALSNVAPIAASRAIAYETTGQVYKEDPATSKSPFVLANNGLSKLVTHMGSGKSGQQVFWNLVRGPLDYLWSFARMETACHLQGIWEKEVLVELQGLSDQQSENQVLLGENGLATKFAKGPAEPFMGRSLRKGYYAKSALGEGIPFEPAFLSFMTKGAISARPVQAAYTVSIRGLPTDTSKGAKLRAHATRLEVQCAKETRTLVNLNYPVSKDFYWSPQDCEDVVFEIEVGKLVLTKKYIGYQAFPEFLRDFKNGLHTFYPSDFPNEQADLKRLGIKSITAKYRFKGHKPVLKLLGTAPGRAPRSIATCWDQ